MSKYMDNVRQAAKVRVAQLEAIEGKLRAIEHRDLTGYEVDAQIEAVRQDIKEVMSNVAVAADFYEAAGLLNDNLSGHIVRYIRAIVVYREICYEVLKLHDCTFAVNTEYCYLNDEGVRTREAELAYLADNPAGVEDYLRCQRARIRANPNYVHVQIDESLPGEL